MKLRMMAVKITFPFLLILSIMVCSTCLYSTPGKAVPMEDTVRNVIINRALFEQITFEKEKEDTFSARYKALDKIKLNDTIPFKVFIDLLEYETITPGKYENHIITQTQKGEKVQYIIITKAILSEINFKLSQAHKEYEFYSLLRNLNINDTIPFKYIIYLWEPAIYNMELAKKNQQKRNPAPKKEKVEKSNEQEITNIETSEIHKQQASKPNETNIGIFRVQIAASRIPLKKKKLDAIYQGPKKIIINQGEGWYRYSVGECPSYDHATRLKAYLQIHDAFEVYYQNNRRKNAWEYRNNPDHCPEIQLVNKPKANNDTYYKVQIAASRTKLTPVEIQHMYCGALEVTESYEENWYKYTIGNFNSRKEADLLSGKLCTPGSFVVGYMNGKRIP
jgi:hypothetical protein